MKLLTIRLVKLSVFSTLISCNASTSPIPKQEIAAVGGCMASGLCSVLTTKGLRGSMYLPLVGDKVCSVRMYHSNELLFMLCEGESR